MSQAEPKFIANMNERFEEWQKQNPGKKFKDFYGELVAEQLSQGKPHATLGGNLKEEDFETSGKPMFERLKGFGLTEDDICVDYGCGTLRVGIHTIRYLKPGNFWGLEISEFLVEEGRKLIGELAEEKKPHLHVISPEAVEAAAAAKPTFLVSTAVLIHVHPAEVPEYVSNVMKLIGDRGTAVITAKCVQGDTIQYAGRSWAHSYPMIERMFAELGGKIEVLEHRDIDLTKIDTPADRYTLRITAA